MGITLYSLLENVSNMRRRAWVAGHSVHPNGASLHVFKQFSWLEVGLAKVASPRPAHHRVTQTIGQLNIHDFD